MTESNDLPWEMDNVFIPKYVPDNLNGMKKTDWKLGIGKINVKDF